MRRKKDLLGNSNCRAIIQKTKRLSKNGGRVLPDDKRQVLWRREPVSWNSLGDRVAGVGQNGLGAMAWELVVGYL